MARKATLTNGLDAEMRTIARNVTMWHLAPDITQTPYFLAFSRKKCQANDTSKTKK